MQILKVITLMIVVGISSYSIDQNNLMRISMLEKVIEKNFIINHSQISNEGKFINCKIDINLFENSGLVRLVGENIIEVNELILKTKMGFFDEYFKEIVDLIKKEGNYKNYEIKLIFVTAENNELIAKRDYII